MNSKGHFFLSLYKSVLRIIGCFVAIEWGNLAICAYLFMFAEVLGIFEEVVDKR